MSLSTPSDFPEILTTSTLKHDEISTLGDFTEADSSNRISQCIVTGFPPDTNTKWLLPNTYFTDTTIINDWCGQFEICSKTSKLHFHLFVVFNNKSRMKFTTLCAIFKNILHKQVNIKLPSHRISKKSRECAVNYVLAPTKRAPETQPFIWEHNKHNLQFNDKLWGERTSPPSKQDNDKTIIDHIESKPKHWTWEQIVHETYESKLLLASCSWGSKFHAGRYAEVPRRKIKDVIILYGAGGTGKTTLAQKWDCRDDEDYQERYYKRNYDDGKFWGGGRTGYKSQRVIHLEEFCGQESASKFKELCDLGKVGPSVNIKNGGIELNHDTIIITSNHHPAAWYRHLCMQDNKQWYPIARRFTQVWFFPENKPNGTPNRPTTAEEYFYIDQTTEFNTLIDKYNDALQHAKEHWNIPDSLPHSDNFNQPPDQEMAKYCKTGKHPLL